MYLSGATNLKICVACCGFFLLLNVYSYNWCWIGLSSEQCGSAVEGRFAVFGLGHFFGLFPGVSWAGGFVGRAQGVCAGLATMPAGKRGAKTSWECSGDQKRNMLFHLKRKRAGRKAGRSIALNRGIYGQRL